MQAQTSTKPYLLRALYEWCTENGYTPCVAVRVDDHTRGIPPSFVRNGEIVFDISFNAVAKLNMGNDMVEFEARLGGRLQKIAVPVDNVLAIYANENGQGMAFPIEETAGHIETAGEAVDIPGGAARVDDIEDVEINDEPPPDGAPKGGRPRLKVVK
jgi:stringent starvation protein B